MKKLFCLFLLLALLPCLPAGAEDWTYDSGMAFVRELTAMDGAVALSSLRGDLMGESAARLVAWSAATGEAAVLEGEARPGEAVQDAAWLGGDSFAVLSGAVDGRGAWALECVSGGETLWRSGAIPGASQVYALDGRLLVNSHPALGSTRLLAFDGAGTLLWTRDFDEHITFEGVLAAGDGLLAYGWADIGDGLFPRAFCLDAGGAEQWRYAALEPGEAAAACMDGEEVLLLMDNLGGDGWPTRLTRLRAGAVVWQQDYPSARVEGAATQGTLDMLPYEGGALIALRFGYPLAGECLLRQVDARGGVVAEWCVAFPELYGVRMAAFVPCGEAVYLTACGEPPEAAAVETAGWFDKSGPTLGDFADLLVVREVELPEG